MLTIADFDQIQTPMNDLFEQLATSILNDIARRLAGVEMTSGAAWQVQRIIESGMTFEDILLQIGAWTSRSEKELKKAFETAGVRSVRYDTEIFTKSGVRPLTRIFAKNFSPAMMEVLGAGLKKTANTLRNLTLTTASQGQHLFIEALDLMHTQLTTGTMSYDQALRAAVKYVIGKGVRAVDYDSGHVDHIDVAARRALLTGVSQTTAEVQIMNIANFGTDLVQVSAHYGARNKGGLPENHEMWQGLVYSISGMTPGYPDFYEWTGYGTGAGLCGWNCRHSFFPFFEGMSVNPYTKEELELMAKKTVPYNGRDLSQYDASQLQRSMEREIRKYKREAEVLAAAKLDNTAEFAKIRAWQKKLRDFTDQTGLQRQPAREGARVPLFKAPPKKAPEKLPPAPPAPKPKPPKPPKPSKPKIEPGGVFDPMAYTQTTLPGIPEPDFYKEIREKENDFWDRKIEHIALFDAKTGACLGTNTGTPTTVGLTPEMARNAKGNITLHNHPRDVPFSNIDIELAFKRMEKEARVVTQTRIFRMIGNEKWEKFTENLDVFNFWDRSKLQDLFVNTWDKALIKYENETAVDFLDSIRRYMKDGEWSFYSKMINAVWEKFGEESEYFDYVVERRVK